MNGKRFGALRADLVRSLNVKVFVLMAVVSTGIAVTALVSFSGLSERTALSVGGPLAETQALYDRDRGNEALSRDIELARTISGAPSVIEWITDEAAEDKRNRALGELEQLRQAFRDGSYFLVANASGNYYFNDEKGSFSGQELRYTIDPENPRDEWYYRMIAGEPGCYLNVDNRDGGIAKVWVNCLIRGNGQALGVVGTGIDLADFLADMAAPARQGVESLYVDAAGTVQARRGEGQESFSATEGAQKAGVFQLIDSEADRQALRSAMEQAKTGGLTKPVSLSMGGRDMLVSVGHLKSLNWFNIAAVDINAIAGQSLSRPLGLLIAVAMGAALLIALMFKFFVLDRVVKAARAVAEVAAGNHDIAMKEGGDQIGSLMRSVNSMAASVRDTTGRLESELRQHQEKMENGAYFDPLTGLVNRRGFIETFEHRRGIVENARGRLGILILDVDNFKPVNEGFGNAYGDAVLAELGKRLDGVTRRLDICGRWSGDEFAVLIDRCTPELLSSISHKVLEAVRAKPFHPAGGANLRVTISIGACLIAPREPLEHAVHRADAALAQAKASGRNQASVYDPSFAGEDILDGTQAA
ncbi:diguanylate cyclase [Corticibacterium sp. UT-5YL-CI-8]|nr:diguanylate cyclase [Tianweitania sp. UT-5YL-CI-8]